MTHMTTRSFITFLFMYRPELVSSCSVYLFLVSCSFAALLPCWNRLLSYVAILFGFYTAFPSYHSSEFHDH